MKLESNADTKSTVLGWLDTPVLCIQEARAGGWPQVQSQVDLHIEFQVTEESGFKKKKKQKKPGVVTHTFSPSPQEAETGGSLELKASLAYRASHTEKLLQIL